jgi:hypothetical protein
VLAVAPPITWVEGVPVDWPAVIDVESSQRALVELRHARRHNHRDAVHWIDSLYRVYISGLAAIIAIVVGSGTFGDAKLPAADARDFVGTAVPWLGLAFAVAVGVGLRSGGRGGPLTLEAATVQHELLSPLPYAVTLREPAIKQLRFMAFTGLCVGGIVGVLAVRNFTVNPVELVVGTAVAFSLALVLAVSVAMIVSSRRVGILAANAVAVVLLAWSALDIFLRTTTSPLTMLASLATAAITFNPLAVIGVVLALAAMPLAVLGIGGTSIDDARRRAGLVSQLRFAVTLQDIRTVVLLRRHLSQEVPRAKPWVRMARGGRVPAIWMRDWRSYFRFPLTRIARMIVLAIVAGLSLGLTWTGVRPAFLIAGLALYLAGYDAVEPLAQEIDHPSRWDAIPDDHGKVLLTHLPAAFVIMIVLCLVTAASALVLVPSSVVLTALPMLIVPVAGSAMAGAAISTVMGSPDVAKIMGGLGADIMGFVLLARLVLPPALTIGALAPIFALGVDANALDTARASNLVTWPLLAAAASLMYVRYQKPARV